MNQTTNYQLNQWDPDDKVLRTDFNADNAKIDAALASLAETAEEHTGALEAQAATLLQKGNCQAYFILRTGTGTNSVSVTFPHKPLLVIGVSDAYTVILLRGGPCNCNSTNGHGNSYPATWSGNTVTWSGEFDYQICNAKDTQYPILAFLAMDE